MASFAECEKSSVFELSGGREMVNEERAVELLAQIPASDAVTKIRLSNKSFSEGAASIIAERLSSFTSLEIADISDIIAGRPEDEALRVLTIICNSIRTCPLKEVNVSDNALGAKGVNACRSILTDKKLEVQTCHKIALL